ncbi:MAG: hypothetical protein CMN00_06335 [Rickettsiales bacterium]|nr:hypothetical protein [Rickettsiales bacterium]|tara:strand:+ start:757 stop:1128 length:372 start_codon:yes stop_codon:yes gene_type:complete
MKIKNIKNKSCLISILENLKIKNFQVKRIFFLKSSKNTIRGNHAHKKCTQIFISLKGSIDLLIEKKRIKKIKLKEFSNFVKVPPLNWVKIKLKKNQILMVLCNENYSEKEYIRNYQKFLKIIS